jgi:hypothetical protein
MLPAGSRLGPYEILAQLTHGMTEAYRAYDHEQGRVVTLQVVRADVGVAPERQRAFEAEIRPALALVHPNILEVHDVGMDARAVYVVTAPIDGDTLRTRLHARAVSPGEALRWSVQLTRALVAARLMGVRHGHLSADSLVVDAAGCLVVLGFGFRQLAPPLRCRSDVRGCACLIAAMMRAGWQTSPPRWRAAGAGALLVAAAASVGIVQWRPSSTTPDRAVAIEVAVAGSSREAVPVEQPLDPPLDPPPGGPPRVDAAPAAAPVEAPRVAATAVPPVAVVTLPGAGPDTRPDPVAPPPKPAPTVLDPVPSPPVLAPVPVRPLTPVVADGRTATSLMTEASVRATEFDLAGAFELARAAATRGDAGAQIAALYLRGLIDAREAFRDGGPADTLAPVREAIASLQAIAKGRPGSAEIARLMLHAAAAAAQSERDEMSLYLETAVEMEMLQRTAGLTGAPLVSAAETAGDLWLQVHRYDDARRTYTEAADRVGSTLRILSGLARTARRLNDAPAACAAYRRLLDAWGGRPGLPVEIAEARAYVGGCAPQAPA